MTDLDRREFLKACALAGMGLEAALHAWSAQAAPALPALALARCTSSPAVDAAIADEARKLTRAAVDALGGMTRFISRGDVVWVKPNIGWDRSPEQAANTNPDVVATLVQMCLECGAKRVVVSDNPCNTAARTFAHSGIQDAVRKVGGEVRLPDDRKFKTMAIKGDVLKEWEIDKDCMEVDKFINVPIVKHHGLSKATVGMKNLMGITGGTRNRMHQDLDRSLADLASFRRPTLVVVDAVRILTGNGPQGGDLADVKRKDIVLAGTDQVAVDALGVSLLGHGAKDIGYITQAAARGLGTPDYESLSPKRVEIQV